MPVTVPIDQQKIWHAPISIRAAARPSMDCAAYVVVRGNELDGSKDISIPVPAAICQMWAGTLNHAQAHLMADLMVAAQSAQAAEGEAG